jgi:hypothetical protein
MKLGTKNICVTSGDFAFLAKLTEDANFLSNSLVTLIKALVQLILKFALWVV